MPKRTRWPPCKVCSHKKQEHARPGCSCQEYIEMPLEALINGRWRKYWAGLDVHPKTWRGMERVEAAWALLEGDDA